MNAKVNIRKDEIQTTDEEVKENKIEDKGNFVEVDTNVIEAALQKHTVKEDDNTIVEANEETIINKILNQKKERKIVKEITNILLSSFFYFI
jgi:hypothetical protein